MKTRQAVVAGATVWIVAAGATLAYGVPATAAPAAAAKKAWSRSSDFNGDGFNDLAVGVPGGTIAGKDGAGYVAIIPGSRNGLVIAKRQLLSQDTAGVPGTPAQWVRFGESVAPGDFNGDGFADLAVGAPRDGASNSSAPGSLTVFFGSRGGLTRSFRVMGTAGLGTAVTAADMDGDGRPEIIATETQSNFGRVFRFTVAKNAFSAVRATVSAVYGLGALASGDVNGDGYDDLVTLFQQVGGSNSFAYFTGSKAGLAAEPVNVHVYDGGADIAMGDLNRDGKADLVVGRPLAMRPVRGGEATVWYGSTNGFAEEPNRTIHQDSTFVPDKSEEYDHFGSAVAIGDITGDGNPELAIGAQRESTGAFDASGAVTVLLGSHTGPSTSARWLVPGQAGLAGKPEKNRQFGWLAAIRDFNGDRLGELAVSAIGGNASTAWPYYGDGSVTVLPGRTYGVSLIRAQVIDGKSLKTPFRAAQFGWSLGR